MKASHRWTWRPGSALVLALALCFGATFSGRALASEPEVVELVLDNGVRFLLVQRPGLPMVSAVWAVHVGSADEEPGRTGVAHLLEHLMFNGSRTIGAIDLDRELSLREEEDELRDELRASDLADRRRRQIERRLTRIGDALPETWRQGEYALIYTREGAVGVNALTRRDLTAYFMMLPRSKLELWFWMESDRLLEPVFRDVYSEHDVVTQERRQRIDSTPTGEHREELQALFWGEGHPYSWPPIGRPEELRELTRPVVRDFYDRRYRSAGLTAVLVGDFDLEQVREWAELYFGRLAEREHTGSTPETEGRAGRTARHRAEERSTASESGPRRFVRACDCATSVEMRYPTVPFGHDDVAALDLVAGLLSGRTGRLQRSLVLDLGIAHSAGASHAPLGRDGSFDLWIEARDATDTQTLLDATLSEIDRLAKEPVEERELQKVKNQVTTQAAKQIEEPLEMALRLAIYDALGDWRWLRAGSERLQEVGPEDVRRVVRDYLRPELATVLELQRTASSQDAP